LVTSEIAGGRPYGYSRVMARPLRIEYADALYHVMSRGNDRRPIVQDDADLTRRLQWLQRTVEVYRWRLRAFVLMDNLRFRGTPYAFLAFGGHHTNLLTGKDWRGSVAAWRGWQESWFRGIRTT
jgi:hypothetical protein